MTNSTKLDKIIRKMKLTDIPNIFLISQRYFVDSKTLSAFIIDQLFDDRFSFVCEIQSKIVGFVLAEKSKEIVVISSLCVEKEFSNLGIGKDLLLRCIEEIKSILKTVRIQLMVSAENEKAIKLYKSVGFEIIESDKAVYFDGSDGFIMQK